jgi:hypothetical protein
MVPSDNVFCAKAPMEKARVKRTPNNPVLLRMFMDDYG